MGQKFKIQYYWSTVLNIDSDLVASENSLAADCFYENEVVLFLLLFDDLNTLKILGIF